MSLKDLLSYFSDIAAKGEAVAKDEVKQVENEVKNDVKQAVAKIEPIVNEARTKLELKAKEAHDRFIRIADGRLESEIALADKDYWNARRDLHLALHALKGE